MDQTQATENTEGHSLEIKILEQGATDVTNNKLIFA